MRPRQDLPTTGSPHPLGAMRGVQFGLQAHHISPVRALPLLHRLMSRHECLLGRRRWGGLSSMPRRGPAHRQEPVCRMQSRLERAGGASWQSAGHLLTADSKCSKITCGVGASKCKKCKSPEQSSANEACLVNRLQSQKHAAKDQCEECHEGFELTADFKCTPFTCTTGSDAGCAVCRSHGLILMSASPGC